MDLDSQAQRVKAMWDRLAVAGDRSAGQNLDITVDQLLRYADGDPTVPMDLGISRELLRRVAGQVVLCLASGGGRQSAVFGLLGARVTVLDLCAAQLECDRRAAERYGYAVRLVEGDMRDLSRFPPDHFDVVYQAISMPFVPDVREVYAQVHRILKPGGTYCVCHCNPATYPTSFLGGPAGWDGVGYRIADPYRGGPIFVDEDGRENQQHGEPTGEHRHLLRDIFGGLIELGFEIRAVEEDLRHLRRDPNALPGSYDHMLEYVAEYFDIVCTKAISRR